VTPEQMALGLKKLKASYPSMAPLEDSTTAAYAQELGILKWEDFSEASKACVRHSKFFPSISELLTAADEACRKRLAEKDHEEREERLALQASEDKIMDPKSDVHRVVIGPKHQEFLDYLRGERVFPQPEWMRRKNA
jgi:hypothetical protein